MKIDGLPINSMVDLSMANCECHNHMVLVSLNGGLLIKIIRLCVILTGYD